MAGVTGKTYQKGLHKLWCTHPLNKPNEAFVFCANEVNVMKSGMKRYRALR